MLNPLTQFYCDTCGGLINSPEEGWIEWITKDNQVHSFRIIHHFLHSPIASPTNEGCYQHTWKLGKSDSHLDHFIDEDYKMARILKFLDIGPYHDPDYIGSKVTDIREYVEMVRRFTIPYYEEARKYWEVAMADGFFQDSNEVTIYSVNNLKRIIERYSNNK